MTEAYTADDIKYIVDNATQWRELRKKRHSESRSDQIVGNTLGGTQSKSIEELFAPEPEGEELLRLRVRERAWRIYSKGGSDALKALYADIEKMYDYRTAHRAELAWEGVGGWMV